MPCEILVAAVPKIGVTEKGYPLTIKDTPCQWGGKEGLPNWVILKISDASKSQVEHYLESWYKSFVYEVMGENASGYRIKITADPASISATGKHATIKPKIQDYLVNEWGCTIVNYDGFQAVVDIPKPVDLLEVKAGIMDIFKERVDLRRYYFSSADVDLASANGGLIELTKAQVLNRIKNKMDE